MPKIPTNIDKIDEVQTIFTDRDDVRKAFWNAYETHKNNLDKEIKVITFYGVGGIGKTTLIHKLISELKANVGSYKYIYYNLDSKDDIPMHNKRKILEMLRNQLADKYGFYFPMYDVASYYYAKNIGEKVTEVEIKSMINRSPVLSEIFNLIGCIPVLGIIPQIIKAMDTGVASLRTLFENRRRHLLQLQDLDPSLILSDMQYYFSLDLAVALESSTEPLVIFFDTYERLVNELEIGESLLRDSWLWRDKTAFICCNPKVLWVIAGRESLKWNIIDNDWDNNSLEQHLLGDLSQMDTDSLLLMSGVDDAEIRNQLYNLTGGVPICLDLCVKRYRYLLEKAVTPDITHFGNNVTELVGRFAQYFSGAEKDIVYLMSCVNRWTKGYMEDLAREILGGYSITVFHNILGLSFILSDNKGTYWMHDIIRNVFYLDPKNILKEKVELHLEVSRRTRLDELSKLSIEYDGLLEKYITNLLAKKPNAEELMNCYNTFISLQLEDIKKYYMFGQRAEIAKILADYALTILGECKETAKLCDVCGNTLRESGRYSEALNYAEKAYEIYVKICGDGNNFDAVVINNNIGYILREIGKYTESLKVYKKGYLFFKNNKYQNGILECLDHISYLYGKLGRYKRAIALGKVAIRKRKLWLKEDDSGLPVALNSLGYVFYKTGNFSLAEEYYVKAAQIREKYLGKCHPRVAANYNNIALMQIGKKEYGKATKNLFKALKIFRDMFGYEHPYSVIVIMHMVKIRMLKGKYFSSEKYCKWIVIELSRSYDKSNPSVIEAIELLGEVFINTNRKKLSESCDNFICKFKDK